MFRIERAHVAVLLVCAFTLGLGLLLKDQCTGATWDGFQYRALCYNDLAPLYGGRHFDTDTFPYTDHGDAATNPDLQTRRGFVEYPALTGLFMWFMARLGTAAAVAGGVRETSVDFVYWNAMFLAGFALATAWLLVQMTSTPRRALYFAAATPVVFYSFHNWDLLAVFFTVLALYWFERQRYAAAGVAVAMGASAKIFPILLAPVLALVLAGAAYRAVAARDRAQRLARVFTNADVWRLTGGTIGGLAAVNLPFLLFGSRELFLETYRFHLERVPNFESIWHIAGEFGRRWGLEWLADLGTRAWLDEAGLVLFAVAYLVVAVLAALGTLDARRAAFAVVLVFLLLNKIFSVQYALWVLPFVALLPIPAWGYGLFAAAEALVYYNIFRFLFILNLVTDGKAPYAEWQAAYEPLAWSVLARTVSLALLLVLLFRGARRGAAPSPPVPSGTDQARPAAAAPQTHRPDRDV